MKHSEIAALRKKIADALETLQLVHDFLELIDPMLKEHRAQRRRARMHAVPEEKEKCNEQSETS